MGPTNRVLFLSRNEIRLLAKAFVVLAGLRVGLRVLPFRVWSPLLERSERIDGEVAVGRRSPGAEGRARHAGRGSRPRPGWDVRRSPRPAELATAVRRAASILPRTTCLPRALALRILLNRAGYESVVRIGVVRGPGGGIAAHAWVEAGGRVLIGGRETGRYVTLGRSFDRPFERPFESPFGRTPGRLR